MPTMNMIQALNDAHKVMMREDPDVVVFGEDVGYFGGVFRVTEGLQKESEKLGILPEQGKHDIGSMFEDVYADMPWHIAEQRDEALAESKGE